MKDWFDYRFALASRLRADGWSLTRMADHFDVPIAVVAAWFAPPKRARRRHHCGYRKTRSRNDAEHAARVAAHAQRIKELGL